MKTIVAATRNRHKIDEIGEITGKFGMSIISRDDAGVPPVEIPETGKTFEENSYIKAYEIMKLCGQITVADDSGLVVDCLNGAPGVYSARFAGFEGLWPEDGGGTDTGDKDNNAKLIRLINGVPYEDRTARFVSVITMVYPDGKTIVARGTVEGHLILEERGEAGFGYDPLFIPEGYDKTFGELGQEIKNSISHRARALQVLHEKLEKDFE
ncbi:MAG: RdgB/HAM1 family non-canonical purine NTP pyrophosphatase [Clostridiales bacterium]|nr:RdgB/HAM1 family non-canonical purine NTP pyrophosphatase [Clostridiales bacterium]